MEKDQAILTKFGARVRELRTTQGLSQEAVAALCGLDRTYISGIERGVRNVSLVNLNALAIGFDITLSELMEGL